MSNPPPPPPPMSKVYSRHEWISFRVYLQVYLLVWSNLYRLMLLECLVSCPYCFILSILLKHREDFCRYHPLHVADTDFLIYGYPLVIFCLLPSHKHGFFQEHAIPDILFFFLIVTSLMVQESIVNVADLDSSSFQQYSPWYSYRQDGKILC